MLSKKSTEINRFKIFIVSSLIERLPPSIRKVDKLIKYKKGWKDFYSRIMQYNAGFMHWSFWEEYFMEEDLIELKNYVKESFPLILYSTRGHKERPPEPFYPKGVTFDEFRLIYEEIKDNEISSIEEFHKRIGENE